MLEVFVPYFLCAWNQIPRRNLQTIVLLRDCSNFLDDSTDCQNL